MSWTTGGGNSGPSSGGTGSGGTTRKLNTFLMSEDRWQRALSEHNHRVKHVRPAVDLKSPWGCSRPYVPLPPPQNPNSARSASATGSRPTSASARRGGGGAAAASGRTSCAVAAPTSGRPQSASSQRPGSSMSHGGGRPTSAMSRASGYSAAGAGASVSGGAPSGAQVIAHLPLQQQRLCEEMTKLLSALDKQHSKAVLEHLYGAAEESRLLQSYSGVYPGLLVSHASGEDEDKAFEGQEM